MNVKLKVRPTSVGEAARLGASLEELAQLGCPVDRLVATRKTLNQAIDIEQIGGIHEAQFFETADDRMACIVALAITNLRSRPIDIAEAYLRADWEDKDLQWLEPFETKFQLDSKRNPLVYRLDPTGPMITREEVLNHLLVDRRRLAGGRSVEGLLLAMGGRMPDSVKHGQWHTLSLTILTADHCEYTASLRLWTERLSPRKMKTARPRLFVNQNMASEIPGEGALIAATPETASNAGSRKNSPDERS
jgi:hypothetical protein